MGKRTERSRETYNNMAAEYDTSPEGAYTRPHKEELARKVTVQDGDSVLDVACGNGFLLGELTKKASIHAFGVDLSEKMIAAAKTRHPDCTFAVNACVPLPFEENCMDAITVSCAFHHFEDPGAFACECMRVLKKDGKVYMAEPYFAPVIRILANLLWIPFAKSGDVKVYHEKDLHTIFRAAGFGEIETYVRHRVVLFG
ncbi:MAG: class I SAM-dependent methyltransferase [Angelakisella sp.]